MRDRGKKSRYLQNLEELKRTPDGLLDNPAPGKLTLE
jgi:hypothetical protein